MAPRYAVVDPSEIPSTPFPESGIHHRKLTEVLGCEHVRITIVTLKPGEATAPHTHERQEEVYITPTGGTVIVDGESVSVPPGGLVRFAPDVIRSVSNDTTGETQEWLMLGAPPYGTVDDFGEYVMPTEEID